ncbi:alkaline phosphatase family protein [Kiloniella laminariae]|uniref:Alkaline phosphatase family protein n=1 Tax=Kiloniella laminariae TaxID=454162 RepID=A0ABT4LHY6_9PROT|nr:alkaline phosphatase family protein [Kiloniella laminariae]MCZ4280701.1 alkaline phosphatase family protein [Kiloniella laminariae]
MGNKILLVIMDGVGYDTAVSQCGYLEGMVELGRARRWKMRTALPTISAAMYETIHSGLSPIDHGVTGNEALRPSIVPNVFQTLHDANFKTAAVAHSYFHTLYNGPYDLFDHIEVEDEEKNIQFGRFYSMEGYNGTNICAPAEIDLCAQASLLIKRHSPDYLLLHSSSVDSLGHRYTADSSQYRIQTWHIDNALARGIPRWLEEGYEVIVTADHGMNADGHHGGAEDIMRHVAFYYFGKGTITADKDSVLDQLAIAPSVLQRLGATIPDSMKAETLFSD